MNTLLKLSLAQVPRALRLYFVANIMVCLWGRRGMGKSSVVRQSVPKGWGFYDFRLSDKEAPDLGGIPYPVDIPQAKGKACIKRVEYLMTTQLPFDTEEQCVINFDEIDRTSDMSVQNAFLQLSLDRRINGHPLSPHARLVACGNGATDTGTIPLSKAAAGRMGHLYIETQDSRAMDAWLDWAKGSPETSPHLQSFAKYNAEVWTDAQDVGELEEYGSPTPRTFCMADTLWQAAQAAKFETQDILLPVLAGCVGTTAAHKMLAWYKLMTSAPSLESIESAPRTTPVPQDNGILFALGLTMARQAKPVDGQPDTTRRADKYAEYVIRWPDEQARAAINQLTTAQPRLLTSPVYLGWAKNHQP